MELIIGILFLLAAIVCLSAFFWINPVCHWVQEKHPAFAKKAEKFFKGAGFLFLVFFYGVMMSHDCGAFILMPFIFIPLWVLFYKMIHNKWWTAAYAVFCLCSIKWVFYLSGYTESWGAHSIEGLIFFFGGTLIILGLSYYYSKLSFSKVASVITMIACIIATILYKF